MKFRLFVLALVGCALIAVSSSQSQAAFITDATKIAGNGTAINVLQGGLNENVEAYTDRTHILVNIPNEIEGGDLVQVSNDDKNSDPYELEVTIGTLTNLYIGLDDRNQPQPRPWMDVPATTGLPTIFFDTGGQIDIDESADGDIDQSFSLWATIAPPGTYTLSSNLHGGNNYIVFADNKLIPEPSSALLVGLGMLGVVFARRRRK